MNSKRRLGLFLFSMILWIQLVFGIGLTFWRFWSVGTGQSEIFVGRGPAVRTEDLIDSIRQYCSDDLRILYAGFSEPHRFYVKYKLFPRTFTTLPVDWSANQQTYEVLRKADRAMGEDKHVCLVIDGIRWPLSGDDDLYQVNEQQTIILFSGRYQ